MADNTTLDSGTGGDVIATDDILGVKYQRVKREIPSDALLLFRLGDFYEMFGEDAEKASRILELVLTARQGVPMCGVPHHAANNYVARLLKAGQKVALCEQMEDPSQAKGIVKREVIRVITPGTALEDEILDPR